MSTIKKTFIPFIFNALLFSFTKNANAELSKDEWFEINKTNAIINPEIGKELEARVTYFSKNKDSFNAKDAGAYIDKQKKLFKEIKDKTSPHYNPGKESTYAKDLVVGSAKGARDLVVEVFELSSGNIKDLPKASAPLEIAKKPFVAITDRGTEDAYEAGYNALLEKGIKSEAREKFLIAKNSIFENLRSLSDQDYENYKESTEYQKVMKEHCPDLSGITPSSSIEEAEIKIPALKLKKIDEATDKANKQNQEISLDLKDQIETIKAGKKAVREIKEYFKNYVDQNKEQTELTQLIESEKETQKNNLQKEALEFDQNISILNNSANLLSQVAFLSKDKSLRFVSNSFHLVSNFATQVKKIEERDSALQKLSGTLNNSLHKLSSKATFEISTLYLSMGLNLISMFSQNEDPVYEAIKEVMSQIHELGVTIRERFDIVDSKLEHIINQINELRDLEKQNFSITQAQLTDIKHNLSKTDTNIHSSEYRLHKDIKAENERRLKANLITYTNNPLDSQLFHTTLGGLTENALNHGRKSQKGFFSNSLFSVENKIQELKNLEISELGILISSELFPDLMTNELIKNLKLDTKRWSESSNLISELVEKRLDFEKSNLDRTTLLTLEKVKKSAFDYTQTLAELVHKEPNALLNQLNNYKENILSLINLHSQNYTHYFSNETSIKTDGTLEELLERANSLPQPNWGKISGTSVFESTLFGSPDKYEPYTQVPDSIWQNLSPIVKLLSWLQLPTNPIRVTYILEYPHPEAYFWPIDQKVLEEDLKNKILYNTQGNIIKVDEGINLLKLPFRIAYLSPKEPLRKGGLFLHPRLHWLFLTTENSKEKVLDHYWSDLLIFSTHEAEKDYPFPWYQTFKPVFYNGEWINATNTPNFKRNSIKDFFNYLNISFNKEFVKKYIFSIATYNHYDQNSKPFSYLNKKIPFVKSNELYSSETPRAASVEEKNYEIYLSFLNSEFGWSPNYRLLLETPVWRMNQRLEKQKFETKKWLEEAHFRAENSPITNARGNKFEINSLKEKIDLNKLVISKGIDLLYPNLSLKEEAKKDYLLSAPNSLYTGNEIEAFFKLELTTNQIKNLVEDQIEDELECGVKKEEITQKPIKIRKFLTDLSIKEYQAPSEIVNALYSLESLKNN